MADQQLYGFNRVDADGLLALLGNAGSESLSNSNRRRRGIMLGKTKTGGIAANNFAKVILQTPSSSGWEDSAAEEDAWALVTAIAANRLVLLVPIQGRLLALELC